MNFQTMEYFLTLATSRTISEAASQLNITQQTLSSAIAHAEKELSVQLIVRTTPLRLTYAGEQFLLYAQKMIAERRAMMRAFKDISGDDQGRLRIGVSSTRGHVIMPHAIAHFQERHPGIEIELAEGENEALIEMLHRGTIDLMVGTLPANSGALEVHNLVQERMVLLVQQSLLEAYLGDKTARSIAHIKATGDVSELASVPFVLLGKRDIAGSLARDAFMRAGFRPKTKVISSNSETLIALALRGVGACFLPSELVASTFPDPEAAGMMCLDLGPSMYYPISVAWRHQDHIWSGILAFYEVLSEQFADGSRIA